MGECAVKYFIYILCINGICILRRYSCSESCAHYVHCVYTIEYIVLCIDAVVCVPCGCRCKLMANNKSAYRTMMTIEICFEMNVMKGNTMNV